MNKDEQLKKDFTFDQYGRYAVIRDIINVNRKAGEKFKVLDVGGRGNFLRFFLPEDNVFFLDPFLDSADNNFIKGDGCEMPLGEGSFDWVVSADVFEHIPVNKRKIFLDENIRVARLGVILAAPFYSPAVEKAEINVNECYKILSGKDYVFLKEHIDNGLPIEKDIEEYIARKNHVFQKISNNNLLLWELSINLILSATTPNAGDVGKEIEEFNYFYNSRIFPYDFYEPSYRKIYFIKKDKYLKNLDIDQKAIGQDLFSEAIANITKLFSRFYAATKVVAENKNREIDFMLSSKFWKLRNKYLLWSTYLKRMRRATIWIPRRFRKIIFGIRENKRREIAINEIAEYSREHNKCSLENFNKKISVVMLSFNRLDDLKKSVDALYNNFFIPFEFIILDNGSNAEIKNYLKSLREQKNNLQVIFEKKNLGCAGGRKKAFSQARGDYIISLDSDIVIMPFCLENMIKTMEENGDVAGVCCKAVFPNKKIQFNGGNYKIEGRSIKFHPIDSGKIYRDVTTVTQTECNWIPGGATIWRKDILVAYSIDDMMQGSHEDAEYSLVLQKERHKLLNCPKAIAVHNHIIFNEKVREDKKYYLGRYNGEKIFFAVKYFHKKHGLIISDKDVLSKLELTDKSEAEIIECFMNPIISVIIPCYNYGKYIKEAVESVLNQTFKNYEIIIVDDGSTDQHTLEVLDEIEKTYPEIRIIHQKNRHSANARNNGIKASRGEFLLPLDADDTLEPEMLEKCYEEMLLNSRVGAVYTYIRAFGDIDDYYWRNQEYNFYDLLFQNHPTTCSLIRKKAWEDVGGYDENMKDGYEDWEFWISMGEKGWFMRLHKEFLFNYRKHGKSMSHDAESNHEEIVAYIRKKHKALYTKESLNKIKSLWKKDPSYLSSLKAKLQLAGVLDGEAWLRHPLRTLVRCIPIRIKEKINAKLKKDFFDTSYYGRGQTE